jgi:predicted PurR-regulated permease PerM
MVTRMEIALLRRQKSICNDLETREAMPPAAVAAERLTATPMPIPRSRTTANDAIVGIWTILLSAAVVTALYIGRDILIPLALASFLTFLLAPLVSRLQRWLGRIGAVLTVVALLLGIAVGGGWILTRQIVDLADELPNYKENIRTKLRAFRGTETTTLDRLTETVDDLKKELPGASDEEENAGTDGGDAADFFTAPSDPSDRPERPTRVQVVEGPETGPLKTIQLYLSPLLEPLGRAALVLLLLIFMLLKREDLRARVIRLIGQGRISATTRAMDDAGARVSRYLLMLLIVNVTYGVPVAIGLYFIGVPNAILWGTFAIILRFIPYIGPWIAAAFPVLLSLAVSPDWQMPLMTISMFIVLEILSNNVMEPWLYGSSTGVSPLALIVAAVFWTWLWGPVGLVLATPFTVCLVVMGRYIPRMEFLAVLLSDEEALTPSEDCYHRLLRAGEHDEIELVDQFLRTHTPTELYDSVLVPVIVIAETDYRHGLLELDQRNFVMQGLRDLVEELAIRAETSSAESKDGDEPRPPCRVHLVPARTERDEIAALMLGQLLGHSSYEISAGAAKATIGEKLTAAEAATPDVVCISVVAPARIAQVRVLCRRLRERLPTVPIVVGFWSVSDTLAETSEPLLEAGADELVHSLADATNVLHKLSLPITTLMAPAPIPDDEEERLSEMATLDFDRPEHRSRLAALVQKIAGVFEVEIAMITAIGRDRQRFLAQSGLPEAIAEIGETTREASICGHVLAANQALLIEDLARDRRFANNPFVKDNGLRFYAGVPLHTPGGKIFGTLCLLSFNPRRFSEREIRLLDHYATDISEELTAPAQ